MILPASTNQALTSAYVPRILVGCAAIDPLVFASLNLVFTAENAVKTQTDLVGPVNVLSIA